MCKQTPARRSAIIFALIAAAIVATPGYGGSQFLTSRGGDGGTPEIAAPELLASSSPGGGSASWAIATTVLPGYTIRRTVPEVRLQFSVADERGRLINDVLPSDLRILDNHTVVRRIRDFSYLRDLPLQIGMLIDVSDSVHKTVFREKLAAQRFVENVLRPESDRAFLMAFGSEVKLWQASTGNPAALNGALGLIQQHGYETSLYDGVFYACFDQFPISDDGGVIQRILVLFSDGQDTGSLHAMADAISLAQRREIQIFALAVHAKRNSPPGDEVLQRLAEQTGGRFYVANSERDFPAILADMEQQMRTQYAVSFQPEEQTAGFHSLRLEMAGHQKRQIHARRRYYFAAP